MFLDWTNWTFWVTAIALVAFGFCLRDIYDQWYFRKVRKEVRNEVREVHDLTRRLEAATERLNKANADAVGYSPQRFLKRTIAVSEPAGFPTAAL